MAREDDIRFIAYSIWEADNCCDGRHVDHWLRAEIIWEEKQKKKPASVNIKTESKPTTKQKK